MAGIFSPTHSYMKQLWAQPGILSVGHYHHW